MKGLILNKDQECYSLFSAVFKNIHELTVNYNWLISGVECYPQKAEHYEKLNEKYCWLTGEELTSILADEDFQWIWGVLSGFNKAIPIDEIMKTPVPYADGYEGFWKKPMKLQHPLAEVEIVAWDSSCSLFISKNNEIIRKIASYYPQSIDLEQYNTCE